MEITPELIATEIMGWKNDPLGGWLYEVEKGIWVWTGFLSVEPSFYEFEGYEYQKPDKLVGTEIFDPLHDMNHCMMVVEKMKGYDWELYPRANDAQMDSALCGNILVRGNTLNEAILKAALKAKGINLD